MLLSTAVCADFLSPSISSASRSIRSDLFTVSFQHAPVPSVLAVGAKSPRGQPRHNAGVIVF
jgi:hypothetical protein